MTRPPAAALTRRAVLLGAAGAAFAAELGGTRALADTKASNTNLVLAQALTFERSSVSAYEVIAANGVAGPRLRRALLPCRRQNEAHAARLESLLAKFGAAIPQPPAPADIAGLADATSDAAAGAFAVSMEEQLIGVYSASVRMMGHRTLLRTVAATLGAHGQQLELLRRVTGLPELSNAFESGIAPPP